MHLHSYVEVQANFHFNCNVMLFSLIFCIISICRTKVTLKICLVPLVYLPFFLTVVICIMHTEKEVETVNINQNFVV